MASAHEICETFVEAHPADAARAVERLLPSDASALLAALHPRAAAMVVTHMVAAAGAECLARIPPDRAAEILASVRTDYAATLLRRMDAAPRDALVAELPSADAAAFQRLLRHPEGTAGALMDPRAFSLPDDTTVADARTRMRRSPRHLQSYLYVVDRSQRLAGVMDVSELMLARAGARVSDVMHRPVARLSAHADRAAILAHPGWRDYHAMPVTDEQGTLLGVIRYQTLRRLEDESRGRTRESDRAMETAFLLGELLWVGMSGLLHGLASAAGGAPVRQSQGVKHGA
jgi:magnesium transporter